MAIFHDSSPSGPRLTEKFSREVSLRLLMTIGIIRPSWWNHFSVFGPTPDR
jgi:hypothetical protein